jgi:cytochrome c551/c552
MREFVRVAVLAVTAAGMVFGQGAATSAVSPQRAFLNQNCAGCHNDKLKTGGVTMTKLDVAHPENTAELSEKVIRYLQAGLMPPSGMPRPTPEAEKTFVTALQHEIDQASMLHPNPGRPPLHRLNRTEYANSVRDLLGVTVDVSPLLPADDMSHGFDNMADVLTISPALMEGYIRAAGRISREAVGDPAAQPLTNTYSIPRVMNQTKHVEGTPFGTRGGTVVVNDFPADGEYTFKLGFYYSPTGPLFGLNQGPGHTIEVAIDGERVALLTIDPRMTLAKDGIKTPPVKVRAGPHRVSASFPEKFDGPIDDEYMQFDQSLVDVSAGTVPGVTTPIHLHELSITGPTNVAGVSDTPSRRKIFTCRPASDADEVACAKQILNKLARQAYRRPVTPNDLEGLLTFYQQGRNGDEKNPGNFDIGIRTAIQAMLANPEFVFRFEHVPANAAPGTNYRISDLELASRMSYFLWSSAPDDELVTVASQGKLREPATLEKEVRRMLADPKSEAMTQNFAAEWLHLNDLKEWNPDLFLFPNFDKSLTVSARRETELLFDSLMREDRDIRDLITANYTFVDERLAKHYGIPDILGSRFRRVSITDPNRYGILGDTSVLMLTSVATRTKPVARGEYVMQVLLGTPPPPAPPNVPPLPENSELRTGHVAKPLSVRERMQEHRKNEPCKSCHAMMDPIGFSLENFDAVGVWRTNDSGFKIDPSGKMFDGSTLDGPVSLRAAILKHSDSYVTTFAENMMAYGLGRVIDYRDEPFARVVVEEASKNDYRFTSFILGIVKSVPFQMRRVEDAEPRPTDLTADHAANR